MSTGADWQSVREGLGKLLASRYRLHEIDGTPLSATYDDSTENEPVFGYGPDAVADATRALQQAESMLRDEGRSGQCEWLVALLGEFTNKSLVRVSELALSDFCPNDHLVARAGFDLFVHLLNNQCHLWAYGSDHPPMQASALSEKAGDAESTLPESALNASETAIVQALRLIGHRVTTEPLLQRAFGFVNSHGKGILASLVKRGVLTNLSDASPRGYGLPEWDA